MMMLSKILWVASAATLMLGAAGCATIQGSDGFAANSAARRLPPRPLINDPFDALDNPALSFTRRPYRSL
jgi:hypothetical protein